MDWMRRQQINIKHTRTLEKFDNKLYLSSELNPIKAFKERRPMERSAIMVYRVEKFHVGDLVKGLISKLKQEQEDLVFLFTILDQLRSKWSIFI
jgi:hypothetical protein